MKKIKDDKKSFSQVTSISEAREKSVSEKADALRGSLQQIEKQFGKGSIMKLGDRKVEDFPHIPSGILSLDYALGIGGLPKGRIIEIFGPESAGKTSLCLNIVSQSQKAGGVCAYIDVEHALDPTFSAKIGVNIDDLLVSQPNSGEEALEITESLVRSNAVDVVVVDSVAALVPKSELEGNMGDAQMGIQARLMSQAMRKLTASISKSKTLVIFVNQIRQKIGVMYGSPDVTTGGNALKFYASVRLDIRRIEQLKRGEEIIGNRIKVKVIKNKVAPPFRQAEYNFFFDTGFDYSGSILETATDAGVVERTGTWYAYKGERLGQGKENATQNLASRTELMEEIKQATLIKLKEDRDASVAQKKLEDGKTLSVDKSTGEIIED